MTAKLVPIRSEPTAMTTGRLKVLVAGGKASVAAERYCRNRSLSSEVEAALLVALDAIAAEDPEAAHALCTHLNIAIPRSKYAEPL